MKETDSGIRIKISSQAKSNCVTLIDMRMGSKRFARTLLGAPVGKRSRGDYYPTPPEAVVQLLASERIEGSIWEPCCGNGAISRVLEENGYEVVSTDLFDRGYGQPGVDFLTTRRPVENVVTNPPYRMALPFVRHALSCVPAGGKVMMLLKMSFLEGVERHRFFRDNPPARVYVFSRKLRWRHAVNGRITWAMLPVAWFVWERAHNGETVVRWICDEDRVVRQVRPRKVRNKKVEKMTLPPELSLSERQREGAQYSASVKRMHTTATLSKAYEELLRSTDRPTQVKVADRSGISLRTVKKYWSRIKK
jgi:hypothetical protein